MGVTYFEVSALDGSNVDMMFNRTCVDCKKGTKQPNEGTTECLNCIPGRYQTNEKQSKCIECEIGRASDVVARDSECDTCAKTNHKQRHIN